MAKVAANSKELEAMMGVIFRPEKKPFTEEARLFLYNSETGAVLGRTPVSWEHLSSALKWPRYEDPSSPGFLEAEICGIVFSVSLEELFRIVAILSGAVWVVVHVTTPGSDANYYPDSTGEFGD
ncbi:hypothetical protein AAG570_001810 [Ranatra chinensis]|uniref:Uncharacterized protein n=1 Tax=Ranatra chinensis TaxID=642074 RepID=A0ABD0Y9N1_9HEMI